MSAEQTVVTAQKTLVTRLLTAAECCSTAGWRRLILADTLLAAGTGVLWIMLGVLFSRLHPMPDHPRTFWWLWALATLYALFRLGRRMRLQYTQLVLVPLLLAPCLCFVSQLFLPKAGGLSGSDSMRTWSSHYCGGWSRISDDYTVDPQDGPQLDYPNVAGYLHGFACPAARRVLTRKLHHNETLRADWFCTWETGLAYGYTPDPRCLPQVLTRGAPVGWLRLFFTVGPVVAVEAVIRGIARVLALLLIYQLASCFIRGRLDLFE